MKAKVYIETLGCQMNVADTELAATRLQEANFQLAMAHELADVVIFNTCSVSARAAEKVFTRIGEVRKIQRGHYPLIGIMGCVAQLEGESLLDRSTKVDFVVGTRAINRISSIIENALSGRPEVADLGERNEGDTWNVSDFVRHSLYSAFVPIIEGCNKFCSYCIVPYSRGREKSRPAVEIVDEIKRLKNQGYKEVHLIGQNVNSYRPRTDVGMENVDGATPFAKLLRAVGETGIKRVKFTTSFPRDFHRDIVSAIDEYKNLCNWVHLPVQSGSNRVLRAMRRGYVIEDYLERVAAIKNARRRLALTSDIIVGFPGETAKEFEETVDLIRKCRFDGLYIFKYSERPGTLAAGLSDDISRQEKTERFLELESVQKEIQKSILEGYIGGTIPVLVEKGSAKTSLDMTGHSTCNKVVNFPGDKSLLGQEVPIRITSAKVNSLYGEVI